MTMLASVDQRPEKERGTVFSTVMRIFNVFNERAVEASAGWSRFQPDELLTRNGTLYLCTPRLAPERIASLFVGILMTVVTAAYQMAESSPSGRLQSSLGLFLDELANIVPLEDLPSLASQGAGRGIALMSIVQDLSQLRARYGPDRAYSILNNHTCKVLLPGVGDPETAEVLSKLAGQRSYAEVQVTHGGDGRGSRSYLPRLEPLAPPDVLRRLRDGTAMVLHRGRVAALVSLRPWYRQRRLRELARQPYISGAEQVVKAA